MELAWKNGYTGRDVVVAIVDDGVWFNNSDILPNYVSTLFCWMYLLFVCASFLVMEQSQLLRLGPGFMLLELQV